MSETKQDHTSPHVETVHKHTPWGALLSRTLPDYSGPYPVGVCDVELLASHRRTFGSFVHKDLPEAGTAALALDTVLFSLFYPAEPVNTNRRVVWFPRSGRLQGRRARRFSEIPSDSLRDTIDGFIRMASRTPNWVYRTIAYPLAAMAIYGTTFPAQPNVPLRSPEDDRPTTSAQEYQQQQQQQQQPQQANNSSTRKKWPLMIFSHGVGCSRLMYSTFCGEMASRGYIVAAIEHRDGTSPVTTIIGEDGQTKRVDFLSWKQLHWPDLETQPTDDTTLRHEQIKLRLAEIEEVIAAMTRIAQGDDFRRTSIDAPDFDWSRWTGSIETGKPVMAGHSLGGSAAIAAAGAQDRFDFGSVLAFDPAIQRIEPWSSPISAPLLVVNSEEFTHSNDFSRLTRLLEYAKSSLVFSIPGSTHPSFSDVFIILPEYINKLTGLRIEAYRVLDMTIGVISRFLAGKQTKESGIIPDTDAVTVQGDGGPPVIGREGTLLYHEL